MALKRAGYELPVGASPLHTLVHLARAAPVTDETEIPGAYKAGPASDAERYSVADAAPVNGGGQGTVFRATTERFGRTTHVALKQLAARPEDAAHLAGRLSPMVGFHHPHLAQHFEVFVGRPLGAERDLATDMDVVYVASEWVDGEPVADVVEKRPPTTRLRWVVEVGRAAAALHGLVTDKSPQGLIHRDISPKNIIVTPDDRAVLIDLGLVRAVSSERTDTTSFTFRWMAPETIENVDAASPQSDAWAVGQLAYWRVCKKEVSSRASLHQTRAAMVDAARGEGIANPEALADHVVAMLADEPGNRPDLTEWCDALEHLTTTRPGDERASRRRLRVGLVAALGLVAGVAFTQFTGGNDDERAGGGETVGSSGATVTLQQGTNGADTFLDPVGASGRGARVEPSTDVAVECKVHAPNIPTASPAGYWYRLAPPPWNGRYYAVANTFFNGDDVPGRRPYLHDVDTSVPDCEDFDWGSRTLSDVVDIVDAACVTNRASLVDVRQRLPVLADSSADRAARIDAGNGAVEQMIRATIVGSLPRPADEADRRLVDGFVADYYGAAYWFEVAADELEAGGSTGTADAAIEAGMSSITDAVDSVVRLGADNCAG